MAKDYEEDDDIYTGEAIEEFEDEDELSDVEQGFMKGYNEFKGGKCCYCEKVIGESPVEMEIDGETYRFCSSRCAEKFMKKKKE